MRVSSTKIIAAQRLYADTTSRARTLGLVVPEAFVRGIRHIGYRSNIEAIAELVDNSIQAYAERVDLVLGFTEAGSTSKFTQLAVVDDGHGIGPNMMRFAMMWGGTHRENDRGGLGRFGYGLPCSTVSMGRRFTIYSKLARGRIYAVTLDLDLLSVGGYLNADGEIALPPAKPATLPTFLRDTLRRIRPDGWKSGTIVLVDKLDRLDWATASGLRRNLVRQFGVVYHKLLRATSIHVDGEQVRPIDPLFLEPEDEFHALDDDRAHALDPVTLRIEGSDNFGAGGEVTLRYAWLPPSFGATDKSRDAIGINANARFPIIKQYHGIVFSRNGRVVDVHSRTPWTTFINNDRYIRIEIEFSASLDEAFGVTTSKQQVSVSPEMWDRLRMAGLQKAIEHLRSKVKAAKSERQRKPTRVTETMIAEMQAVREPLAVRDGLTKVQPQRRSRPMRNGDDLVSAVRDVVSATEPAIALRMLLDRIGESIAGADMATRAVYELLLRDWATALAALPPNTTDRLGDVGNAPR